MLKKAAEISNWRLLTYLERIEMLEYRSVVYSWMGRGWTQEIGSLRIDGQEQPQWEGKRWVDYLNESARSGWELVTVAPMGGGEMSISTVVAYFKREI